MIDSEELFGASNLTEEEYPQTLTKYKKKVRQNISSKN